MTTAGAKASSAPAAVDERPWYDLIDDPEPPEDAMQEFRILHVVVSALLARYDDDPTTLVAKRSNLVYDSAVPGSVVAPDAFVVFGVDAQTIEFYRRSYRIDEWGPPPAFVLEAASESTATRDLGEKREIYARMGAQEYWRLDRAGKYYGEPLVGERLIDGEYARYALHTESNGDIWSRSEVLGVDFYYRVEDGIGRFLLRDSKPGEWLNTLSEEIAAHAETEAARQDERQLRQAAEARAQDERQLRQSAEARAREAEARNQELQAELERLRRQQ